MALPARLRHSISKREAETWLHVQNSSYPRHNYHNYIPPKDSQNELHDINKTQDETGVLDMAKGLRLSIVWMNSWLEDLAQAHSCFKGVSQ